MPELWQEEAARIGGAAFAQVMTELVQGQRALLLEVAALKDRDAVAEGAITKLLTGFPSGDFDGHRRYHEAVIEWRELRNKIVREGLIKLSGMGLILGTGWVAKIIWDAIKVSVKQ